MAQETDSTVTRDDEKSANATPRLAVFRARARRVLPWLAPTVIALAVLIPAWLDARLGDQGLVRSGFSVLGTTARAKSAKDLTLEIAGRAAELERRRLAVRLLDKRLELDPKALSLRIDPKASAERVLQAGADGGFVARVVGFWKRRWRTVEVPLVASVARPALEEALLGFEAATLKDRPFSGGIELTPAGPKAVPPRGGRIIDRTSAEASVLAAFVSAVPREITLPVVTIPAPLPPSAAEEVAARARTLLARPLTLRSTDPPANVLLGPTDLGPVLETERDGSRLRLRFKPDGLARLLEPTRRGLEREPVNAKFVVDAKGAITIEPSRPGLRIDLEQVDEALFLAAESPEKSASLPLVHGPLPALDTARAATLGVKGLVSSFTTRHPCCERRVDNIHRIADILDGTVVEPGQTVSVNQLVGPRTVKNGFVLAPTIEEREIVDSIGGGISQFATTFFNALFHGGYDIVERQPHTFWFPRYPMGHEATLSWPKPDIIFRNDTAAGLLIKTHYTGTTITVKLYGDNGGRKVAASVSGRKDVVEAPLEIVPNPKLPADEEKVKEPGSVGWSVIVSRILTEPDGTKKEERRKVTYRPRPRRIEVHPCRIPKGEKGYTGEQCPEPKDVEEAAPEP